MKEYRGRGKAVSESGAVGGFKQTNPQRGGDKGDKVKEESAFLSHWIHTEEPPPPRNTNLNFCLLRAEIHSSSPARRWTTESWVYLTDQKLLQYRTTLSWIYCTAALSVSTCVTCNHKNTLDRIQKTTTELCSPLNNMKSSGCKWRHTEWETEESFIHLL